MKALVRLESIQYTYSLLFKKASLDKAPPRQYLSDTMNEKEKLEAEEC